MTAPLTDLGKLKDGATKIYKRKLILQEAILKYLGIDVNTI